MLGFFKQLGYSWVRHYLANQYMRFLFILSQTEPEAFNLNVFINAQALPSENETKARATNNLTTTTLHYAGGMREFALDIGAHVGAHSHIRNYT